MHHLKVTVRKYLHSHNHHAMIHKNQHDINSYFMKSTSAHFILFQYLNSFKKFMYYAVLTSLLLISNVQETFPNPYSSSKD